MKLSGYFREIPHAHQEKLAETLLRTERQRYWLRFSACIVAMIVATGMAAIEWLILGHVLSTTSEPDDLFILLAVSPIASITLIMIFILVGVFRGFRENDLSASPFETIGRTAFDNTS